MNKNNLYLAIICGVLLVIVVILSWIVVPSFTVGVITSLIASSLGLIVFFLIKQSKEQEPSEPIGLQVWCDRDMISPPISERIISAKKSLFFVGFTFGTTLKDYGEYLKNVLMSHNNLEVKLLMIHPDSLHVTEHQHFTKRNITESTE